MTSNTSLNNLRATFGMRLEKSTGCEVPETACTECGFCIVWSHVMSCRFASWVRNIKSGRVSFVQLDCMTWKCSKCRKKIQALWNTHIADTFSGEPTLWRITVPEEKWAALSAKIRRLKGSCFRIRTRSGFTVYSNVCLKGSERLCKHDATSIARRDVNAITHANRAISTSRAWKLPPRKPSKCVQISRKQANQYAVRKAAAEFKVPTRDWSSTGTTGIEIDTSGWTEEKILELIGRSKELSAPEPCSSNHNSKVLSVSSNSSRLAEMTSFHKGMT